MLRTTGWVPPVVAKGSRCGSPKPSDRRSPEAFGTLVERASRFLILLNFIEGHTADGLRDELVGILPRLPAG